jgi:hypothetical protein
MDCRNNLGRDKQQQELKTRADVRHVLGALSGNLRRLNLGPCTRYGIVTDVVVRASSHFVQDVNQSFELSNLTRRGLLGEL